jgi:hypothetical protein
MAKPVNIRFNLFLVESLLAKALLIPCAWAYTLWGISLQKDFDWNLAFPLASDAVYHCS